MQAISFEVPWASRLLPHASLWLAMFEMYPSRGGVPDFGSGPAYGGMTFSLSHKRSHRNPVWNESTTDTNEVEYGMVDVDDGSQRCVRGLSFVDFALILRVLLLLLSPWYFGSYKDFVDSLISFVNDSLD